jgi:hypothetical protein
VSIGNADGRRAELVGRGLRVRSAQASPSRNDSPCEVAAHLVGVQVAFGEQVTGWRRRHVPALCGVGRELGDHAEGVRLTVERRLVGPSNRATCSLPARASTRFSSIPDCAGGDAAEHLEYSLFFEDHAAVASARRSTPAARRPPAAMTAGFLDEAPRSRRCRRIKQRQEGISRPAGMYSASYAVRSSSEPDQSRSRAVLLNRTRFPAHDHPDTAARRPSV